MVLKTTVLERGILPLSWHLYISYVDQPNFFGPAPFLTFVDVFDTKHFSVLNYVKKLCRWPIINWIIQILSEKNQIFFLIFAIFLAP